MFPRGFDDASGADGGGSRRVGGRATFDPGLVLTGRRGYESPPIPDMNLR